jgi:hypothetical protein
MDHYAPAHELATHTWRTRTMVVSAIAAVELVALIALGVVLLGKGWFQHERAARVAEAKQAAVAAATETKTKTTKPVVTHKPVAPPKPLLTRGQTSVLVLNGNGQDGAAGAEATVLRQHGYPVAAVYDLNIPIVSALDGLLVSQLKGARLLLIIGK